MREEEIPIAIQHQQRVPTKIVAEDWLCAGSGAGSPLSPHSCGRGMHTRVATHPPHMTKQSSLSSEPLVTLHEFIFIADSQRAS